MRKPLAAGGRSELTIVVAARFDGEKENNMDLRAPSVLIFVVSLVFAALALIGHVVLLPFVTLYGFWVAIIAYLILAIGVMMRT
jgi:hypothetical protein